MDLEDVDVQVVVGFGLDLKRKDKLPDKMSEWSNREY